MPTKNEELLLAIVYSAQISNINWDYVAKELGINKHAAQQRWSVFKKTLPAISPGSSAMSTPKKNAGKGAKTNGHATTPISTKKKPAAKKRKLDLESDEEEGSDDRENEMSHVANTPARRLPVRKARVEKFKEDSTELDEEDEISVAENGTDVTEDELVDEEDEA